jgi:hypothetical protein
MQIIAASLFCFHIFWGVTALRQWRKIPEAMKRLIVKYGKKLKQ